jgi:hypothetical protein
MTDTTWRAPPRAEYDPGAAATRLWHEIWDAVERDVPTFAVGPYPPYGKAKAFERLLADELRRAFAAGAASAAN